jgi:hypothetical protein
VNGNLERIFDVKGMLIKPSVHFGFERNLKRSNNKADVNYTSGNVDVTSSMPLTHDSNMSYNTGAGIVIQHQNIECGLDYNYHTEKKFKAHQGVIKLRLSL